MTPDEAIDYIKQETQLINWKNVQINGIYYRQCTVTRGSQMESISITQYVEAGNEDAMSEFLVKAATCLQQAIASGIVK